MNIKKIIVMVAIALNYLPPCWQWNDHYLYAFLTKYLPLFRTEEVVWFLSEQMTSEQSEQLDSFMKRFMDFAVLTQFVWTNRSDVRMTKTQSKRAETVIVFSTGASDPIMHVHHRVLSGRHLGLSLVVYVSKVSNISVIDDICYKLYQYNFVNGLVYFENVDDHNHLYGLQQYPTFRAENRTDFEAHLHRDHKKVSLTSQDVGGYVFYSPFRQDIPTVFKYQDKFGNPKVDGIAYNLLNTFAHSLNGSLQEYEMPKDANGQESLDMKNVMDLVRSKKIDVSAHAYALYIADDDVDKSFPIMVVKWCLMVPQRNSISTLLYPVQPFENMVWVLVMVVLVLICCFDLMATLWITRGCDKPHTFLYILNDAWLDACCYILNIGTPKNIRINSWTRFNFHMAIFFFGFFLSAIYTSFLGSSLTVTLFKNQINSMEDIVLAQLPVMVVDYELEFLLSQGYEMPLGFRKLLRPVDSATFAHHQLQLNTSFAYFVTDNIWVFLDKAQKYLKHRVFKFSDICFGSYHLAFPIQTDSPVWRDLEYFLFNTHSNGLLRTFQQAAFQAALSAGYIQRLEESHEYTSAGLDHLFTLFLILCLMYVVGGISLIVEILIHRYVRSKK